MKQRCPGCYWAMPSGDKYFCPIFSCPKREPSLVQKFEYKIEIFRRLKKNEHATKCNRAMQRRNKSLK